MKKHVSLFLALLMVVSVFFAIPAEAEAVYVEHVVHDHTEVCEHQAPRAAELSPVGDSVMGAIVPGGEIHPCSHTYKTVQYSSSKHKRVCTKCGYSYLVSHSYGSYVAANGTHHHKVCLGCGYTTSNSAHTFSSWTDRGNGTHRRYCTTCGYTVTKAHVITYCNRNIFSHTEYCSYCGYLNEPVRHTYDNVSHICNCGWRDGQIE